MENKTLICPNCGASLTGTTNKCEYCGCKISYEENNSDYDRDDAYSRNSIFTVLLSEIKSNLEMQAKNPNTRCETAITWLDMNGIYKCIFVTKMDLESIEIVVRFRSNLDPKFEDLNNRLDFRLHKYSRINSFPVISSTTLPISKVREYNINFEKNAENAAKFISDILVGVYNVKSIDDIDVFTNLGAELGSEDYKVSITTNEDQNKKSLLGKILDYGCMALMLGCLIASGLILCLIIWENFF